jgi:AbiV family abortive infection protein
MTDSTRPVPPRDDLLKLIRASAFNARDLLTAARLLLDAGSFPQAHALATLAFEEIGKANLCILVLVPPGMISPTEFWESWRSHTGKLRWARGLLDVIIHQPAGPLQQVLERLLEASKSDHMCKMGGLYVDYADGDVLLPSVIPEEEARQLIDDVQVALDFLMNTWGDEGIFDRIKVLDTHAAELGTIFDQIKQAAAVDPDATLGQLRELLQPEFADPDRG